MKKYILIMIILLLSLTACSSKDSKNAYREKLKKATLSAMNVYSKDMSKTEKKQFDKFANCYVDGIFAKLDDKSIDDLVKAKSKDIEKVLGEKDQTILTDVATKCAKLYKVN